MGGPLSDRTRWRIADDVAVTPAGPAPYQQFLLLPLGSAATEQVPVVVSGTGCALWSHLSDGPQSVAELVTATLAEFPGVTAAEVGRDVRAFVADLAGHDILVPLEDPAITPAD